MFDITPMEVDLEQHREIHLLMLLPKVKLVKQYKVDIKIAKLPLLKKYKNLYLKKELIRFFILNNIDQRVSTSEVIKIRSLLFLKNSFQKYWLLDNFYYRMLFLLKKYERSEFIVAFGGLRGAKPPLQGTEQDFYTVVKKSPLCVLAQCF